MHPYRIPDGENFIVCKTEQPHHTVAYNYLLFRFRLQNQNQNQIRNETKRDTQTQRTLFSEREHAQIAHMGRYKQTNAIQTEK